MIDKKLGIVTVIYNSESVLEDFFSSLEKQIYKNFVVYLIDNNSTDNSVAKGKELALHAGLTCKWFLQNGNLGVAEGNNIGIKAALDDGCGYVLLSNNDIVLEECTIQLLLNGLQETKATMAVPKIYYYDCPSKIWMAGGGFKWLQFTTFHRGENEEDHGQYNERMSVEYAPTCFMLIDASVFSRVGFMDKRYFVYYDDSDFVWRSVKIGSETLMYIPESKLWHKVSSCTGGPISDFSLHYSSRNHVFFALNYCRGFHLVLFFVYLIAHFFLKKPFIFNSKQRKLIFKSYKEGWNLYWKN